MQRPKLSLDLRFVAQQRKQQVRGCVSLLRLLRPVSERGFLPTHKLTLLCGCSSVPLPLQKAATSTRQQRPRSREGLLSHSQAPFTVCLFFPSLASAEGSNQHQAAEAKGDAGGDAALAGGGGHKAVVPRLTSPTPASGGGAARVPSAISGSLSPTPQGMSEEGDSRAKLPADKRREESRRKRWVISIFFFLSPGVCCFLPRSWCCLFGTRSRDWGSLVRCL